MCQNLAVTVLYVPCCLHPGWLEAAARTTLPRYWEFRSLRAFRLLYIWRGSIQMTLIQLGGLIE